MSNINTRKQFIIKRIYNFLFNSLTLFNISKNPLLFPLTKSFSIPYKIRLSAHIQNKPFYALLSAYFKKYDKSLQATSKNASTAIFR